MRVLVIEDDEAAARLVRRVLEEEGYAVDSASTAEEGRVLATGASYDLVVLDLGLRDQSGITVVREMRRTGHDTPVLILTGESAESAMVHGLDAGADDFVTKPFSRDALLARVRALVRRGAAPRRDALTVGNLTLNRLTRDVHAGDRTLSFTPREFALLEYLMLKQDEMASRAELHEHVWNMHFDPGSNVVDAHVARVRRKLEDSHATAEITTVRGAGFRIGRATDPR